MSYNKSHFPDKENLPLLDPLVLSFIHNINDLLANGVLTRSRRAVLMNWKVLKFLLLTYTTIFISHVPVQLVVMSLYARWDKANWLFLLFQWHCLDSLLSIPYNVIQNGCHKRNAHSFFSDSALRSTFADIVERYHLSFLALLYKLPVCTGEVKVHLIWFVHLLGNSAYAFNLVSLWYD